MNTCVLALLVAAAIASGAIAADTQVETKDLPAAVQEPIES